MAITARQLEVELEAQDNGHEYQVLRHIPEENGGSEDAWYIQCVVGPNKGKACWAKSTTADSAANQAAAVLGNLTRGGPI